MKKNLKLTGLSLLVSMLLLTSCNLFSLSFNAYDFSDTFNHEPFNHGNVTRIESTSKRFFDVSRSNPSMALKTLTMDSVGEKKLLVLPIYFSDYSLDNLDKNNGKTTHIDLQNAFFGNTQSVLWESVSSYYFKSSYGKLKITGEVAPWYQSTNFTVSSIKSTINSVDKQTITNLLLREAVENFKATHTEEEVRAFDQDEDGYLDAVYLVYAYPYSEARDLGTKNIFWAFATYDEKNAAGVAPFAHNYAWSSTYFMHSHRTLLNKKPDAHTYIHEVTHLFGIPDYYNIDLEEGNNPTGGFDMMDYTVGDHTALTKLLLEWANPLLLNGEGQVKLRPFTKSGDLLLIPSKWNGHFLDEFIALEYYTPTELNSYDSRLNDQFKLPNRAGVKVYHIDARTVYELRDQSIRTYIYSDEYEGEASNLYELLAHTNSTSGLNRGKKPEFSLYSLLEKTGENTFKNGKKANESTLFYKGDTFGVSTFQDYTFHRGNAFPYTFKIKELKTDYVTIEFTKK